MNQVDLLASLTPEEREIVLALRGRNDLRALVAAVDALRASK